MVQYCREQEINNYWTSLGLKTVQQRRGILRVQQSPFLWRSIEQIMILICINTYLTNMYKNVYESNNIR